MSHQDKNAFIVLGLVFGVVAAGLAWAVTGHWWGLLLVTGYAMATFGPGLADLMEINERETLEQNNKKQANRIRELEKQLRNEEMT